MERTGSGTVGIVAAADHAVFAVVADDLHERGFDVRFIEPGRPLQPDELEGLAVLANKKIRRASLRALLAADRAGVPTWNGFVPTAVLSARLVGLHALRAVGCRVPAVRFEPPDGDYVAKPLFSWDGAPTLNGDGEFYQPLLRTEPVDFKYYAVDDGERVHVRALAVTSKLYGEMAHLGQVEPNPEPAAAVRRLLARTGARALGVDFVRTADGYYAVDVNAAPSFRRTGLEAALADSIAASAR